MRKTKTQSGLFYLGAILILMLVILYSGLRILESTVFYNSQNLEESPESKTIVRDGIAYFPRQDITVLMVLGVDSFGEVTASEFHRNDGAVDVVMLMIFDETNEKYDVLYLNRDTMLQMPVLGLGGKQAGSFYGQLALSHTYGTGMEDSCENTRKAVSNFLYGIQIDYYLSMNMDAIAILNDAVGGVTVTVEEDFSQVDPTIRQGVMTLRGQQAIHYVRTRKDVGDQMNLSRINRQRDYISGFVAALEQKLESGEDFILTAYDAASPYIVSDCSVNTLSNLLSRYSEYSIGQFLTPEGENVLGQNYYEFYADEQKLDALILKLFYAPKE